MKKKILLLCSLLLVVVGCSNSNKYAQEFGVFDIVYPSEDIFDLANKRKIHLSPEGSVGVTTTFTDTDYEIGVEKYIVMQMETYYEESLKGVAYGNYEISTIRRNESNEWKGFVVEEHIPFRYEGGKYYDISGSEIIRLKDFKFLFQVTDLSFKHANGTIKTSKNPVPTYYADGIVSPDFGNGYFESTVGFHQLTTDNLKFKNIHYMTESGWRAGSYVQFTEKNNKESLPRARIYTESTGISETTDFEYKKAYEEAINNG